MFQVFTEQDEVKRKSDRIFIRFFSRHLKLAGEGLNVDSVEVFYSPFIARGALL